MPDRRQFLRGAAGLAVLGATRGVAGDAPGGSDAAGAPVRLIATEEAYAPLRYIREFLKLAEREDTPVTRYLKLYYEKPAVVRQLNDFDVRLQAMDEFGVDMHVLAITAPGVQAFEPMLAAELARQTNDELAAAVAKHPGRFAALAVVAPQSPEEAAAEMERAITRLGMNGVIINSHTNGATLDEPQFAPLLAAAEKLGAPIYLHPTFPPENTIEAYSRYGMMGALWGFQAECSLHAVRMILGGVFDRYPGLQVVLGHLGEGLPYWLGRLDNRYQNILRRGGLEPLGMTPLQKLPSDYVREHFYVTTSGMNWHPPLDYCLDLLGPERVMFAIDYPFEQVADAVGFFNDARTRLPAGVVHRLAHANAEALFGIPVA